MVAGRRWGLAESWGTSPRRMLVAGSIGTPYTRRARGAMGSLMHQLGPRQGAGNQQAHQERGQSGAAERWHWSPNIAGAIQPWYQPLHDLDRMPGDAIVGFIRKAAEQVLGVLAIEKPAVLKAAREHVLKPPKPVSDALVQRPKQLTFACAKTTFSTS